MLFVGKCVIVGLISLSHEKTGPENTLASKSKKVRTRIKYRTLYKSKLYIAIPSDKESSVDSAVITYHLHEVDNLSALK